MKRKIKLLIIIAAVSIAIAGCRSVKQSTTEREKRDSAVYIERETVKDSLVLVPIAADSAMLRALIQCDSMNQAHIAYIITLVDGSRAAVSVKLDNNMLTVGCRCDSLAIYTIYHSRYQSLAESVTGSIKEAKQCEVSHWWDAWQLKGLLLLVIAFQIFRTINAYLSYVKAKKTGS